MVDKANDIADKVKDVVASTLDVDRNNVKEESDLVEDLGADSLDQVELTMAVEDAFDIEIPDDEAGNIKTVAHIIELVKKQKAN